MKSEFIFYLKGMFLWAGWHPEVALRYLPVVAEIKKLGPDVSVLEVGSGGLGIAPYVRFNITGVDIRFSPPFHPRLNRIKAKAVRLPFADKVFDAVVSVDTFEHLPGKDREKAISEMLRCTRKLAVIAVPCGQLSYLQDKKLNRIYRKRFGKKYRFFDEHTLGLPEEKDIIEAITNACRTVHLRVNLTILNNENLKLRQFLMNGWMTKNLVKNIFFRKVLLIALPFMSLINNPPVYRKIFVINKK